MTKSVGFIVLDLDPALKIRQFIIHCVELVYFVKKLNLVCLDAHVRD